MSRLRNVEEEWIPKTKLGELVKSGLITLDKIYQNNLVVKEKEIINLLLPQISEDVVTIKMVQQMTASGQRSKFKAVVIVGTDGFIGQGSSKAREVG
ncbi:MAG: 30S ribosomal protein S5, partial [Promethearchaeota archaeon]